MFAVLHNALINRNYIVTPLLVNVHKTQGLQSGVKHSRHVRTPMANKKIPVIVYVVALYANPVTCTAMLQTMCAIHLHLVR